MNSIIEMLNHWGEGFTSFAGQMLWQSSLLIAAIFIFDLTLHRKVRAAVRYALWLVVLVKLLMPPTLALPTSFAWWMRPGERPQQIFQPKNVVVSFDNLTTPALPPQDFTPFTPPPPHASAQAGMLAGSVIVSAALLLWLLVRWLSVSREVRRAANPASPLQELLAEAQALVGLRSPVRLRITKQEMSPAVCGLFRPVILLPERLAENLPAHQLRAVLLHELTHLKRGDVWVNCLQALLQIAYWWHPLVWLANARLRRVREEAVDDKVMLLLHDDADSYAPTLLEVAKLAFHRPLASLGLVGILESRSALRQRIERLIDFKMPKRAGLSFVSILGIAAFTALAVPMGEAPARPTSKVSSSLNSNASESMTDIVTDPQFKPVLQSLQQRDEVDKAAGHNLTTAPKASVNRLPSFQLASLTRNTNGLAAQTFAPASTNSLARTNLIHTSPPRQAILNKLNQIRLDHVAYDGRPLSEIVRTLSNETKKRDPDSRGINFFIYVGQPTQNAQLVDPATGLPRASAVTSSNEVTDILKVAITINPALTNVLLRDVLDAIVKSSDKPIKYSIMDYGIAFSAKGNESAPLASRRFKVDPNTFTQNLAATSGRDSTSIPASNHGSSPTVAAAGTSQGAGFISTNNAVIQSTVIAYSAIQSTAIAYFRSLGVNLDPPKSVFFNNREGTLWVRATTEDLDIIEATIQKLYVVPPQVAIRIKWVELSKEIADTLPTGLGVVQTSSLVTTPPTGLGVLQTNSLVISLFNPMQAKALVNGLKNKNGVTEISDLSVVTLSGRQAQFKMVNVISVRTNVPSTNGLPATSPQPMAPTLDVIPYVSADGYTVQMTFITTFVDFLGYDDPGKNIVPAQYVGRTNGAGNSSAAVLPLTANAIAWDGQTIAMQCTQARTNTSATSADSGRRLLILITPTLIDPAGNRIHTDEELISRRATPPK